MNISHVCGHLYAQIKLYRTQVSVQQSEVLDRLARTDFSSKLHLNLRHVHKKIESCIQHRYNSMNIYSINDVCVLLHAQIKLKSILVSVQLSDFLDRHARTDSNSKYCLIIDWSMKGLHVQWFYTTNVPNKWDLLHVQIKLYSVQLSRVSEQT